VGGQDAQIICENISIWLGDGDDEILWCLMMMCVGSEREVRLVVCVSGWNETPELDDTVNLAHRPVHDQRCGSALYLSPLMIEQTIFVHIPPISLPGHHFWRSMDLASNLIFLYRTPFHGFLDNNLLDRGRFWTSSVIDFKGKRR